MDEPLVASMIIVTYNNTETIRQCLRFVQAFTHTPHEVIVCDNASTDDTVTIVSSEFPHVKLIRNTEILGFAAANNLGASQALGWVLEFINPDLYVSECWFEPLMNCLESDPNIPTTSPTIRHLAQPEAIEAIGNQVYLSGLTYLQKTGKASRGEAYVPIAAFSRACFVMRRELFEQVGGFCEDYFLYYEDTDLSIRLGMLGLKHMALPAVTVTHDYRPHLSSPFQPPSCFARFQRYRLARTLPQLRSPFLCSCLAGIASPQMVIVPSRCFASSLAWITGILAR